MSIELNFLKEEYLSLRKALNLQDHALQMLVDTHPVMIFRCDAYGIFEILQGKGLQKNLNSYDSDATLNLMHKIPEMLQHPLPSENPRFEGRIHVVGQVYFSLEYRLITSESGDNEGLLGFLSDISDDVPETEISPTIQQNEKTQDEPDGYNAYLAKSTNKYHLIQMKESLRQVVSTEMNTMLSRLLIERSKATIDTQKG